MRTSSQVHPAPGRRDHLRIAGGVLALAAIIVLLGVRLLPETVSDAGEGRVFIIPAGASERIEIPTIDSAIEVPTSITFAPGDVAAITIHNHDDVANRAGPWVIGAGQSYTATFDEPGTYRFDCAIDASESVTVVVEEP